MQTHDKNKHKSGKGKWEQSILRFCTLGEVVKVIINIRVKKSKSHVVIFKASKRMCN